MILTIDCETTFHCIIWEGYKDFDGYGYKQINGRPRAVHRLAWEVAKGDIPKGMFVCHRCDNPSCYNVDHLFLGTPKDNMDDMYAKGRGRKLRGEEASWSKLNEDKVRYIRSTDKGNQELAAELGVTHSLISAVRLMKCWKHVV